jgi:hypothetical protein
MLCQVPSVAPGAAIGAEILGGVGGGDLVVGGGEGFAFGGVLAFAGYRAFWFVVVHEVFGFPFWSVPLLLAPD